MDCDQKGREGERLMLHRGGGGGCKGSLGIRGRKEDEEKKAQEAIPSVREEGRSQITAATPQRCRKLEG